MQDFIQDVASKLGVGKDTAEAATSNLLGLIREHGNSADVSQMLGKLPGASALLETSAAKAAPEGPGGLLGGIGETLGSALGGAAGPALSGIEALTGSGLSTEKLGSLVEMFKDFALPKLGPDLLKRLLSKIPGIGALLG